MSSLPQPPPFEPPFICRTGGTNLRVCLVTLSGAGKFEITQSKYRLTEEQKQEDGQKLFDFCAECLKAFIDANIESGVIEKATTLPLGFTVGPFHPAFTLRTKPSLYSSRTRVREYKTRSNDSTLPAALSHTHAARKESIMVS